MKKEKLEPILYVDDEKMNLNGFKYTFLDQYEIFTAISADEGMKVLDENPHIKLVISDQRMPGKSGFEFLEDISRKYPDIIRIILSAYTDPDIIMDAINKGGIYRYITKPWNKNELTITLENAIEAYNLKCENKRLLEDLMQTNKKLTKSLKTTRENQERYKRLANSTFEGIGYSYNGRIVETNRRLAEMFGYTMKEMLELEIKDLVHQDDYPVVLSNIKNNYEEPYEHRGIKKNGEIIIIESRGKNVTLEDNTYRLSVMRDITESKLYERSLAESEEKFRNIFNSSNDGIIITDFDGKIVDMNPTVLAQLGITKEEAVNVSYKNFILPRHHVEIEKRRIQILNNEKLGPVELYVKRKSGFVFPIELQSQKIKYLGKSVLLSIIRDITERKITEKRILNTIITTEEKERKRFANDLHDGIGPLLSTLKLYFHALNSNKYSDADKTRMHENIDNIIEELINTTRSISNNLMPHILNDFGLDAALKVFIDKINEAGLVKIKYDHENESVQLKKDFEIILYRTISELINNTLKYANAQNIAIRISISEGFVEVFYEDDGKGFDVEKHLTKQSSSLGLKSLIYRIKSHDGQIHFTSEPGKGFRTNISLPIYKQLEKERQD